MKQVKFRQELADLIIAGDKTATWRLFDDKDLRVGDIVQFLAWENLQPFGTAYLNSVIVKKLGSIEPADFDGHETFRDEQEMLETYQRYYGDKVTFDTDVKIIHFSFKPL